MAQAVRYVCGGCGKAVEAWTDGNPYYIDDDGSKRYAYHPDHDSLARCIGNDSPHLCLSCGREFPVDSREQAPACPDCAAGYIAPTYQLGGRGCPSCKAGEFDANPDFFCVS